MSDLGLVERVARFIREERLIAPDQLVVVGLSGGVDSVVLLHVLVGLDVDVVAAHVNYGLRAEESDEDERFVRALCVEMGVPLEAARYDTRRIAKERGQSLQEAARELRYAFFAEVADHDGAAVVAVAHHADDQAETVLLNLFRGTGIDGLGGMPPARLLAEGRPMMLVRPLLREGRTGIEAFASERGLSWREDPSNLSNRYRRGALRTHVMPAITKIFGEAVPNRIERSARLVRAYLDETLDPELEARFAAGSVSFDPGGALLLSELVAQPPAIRTRLILEALRRWLPRATRSAASAATVDALVDAQVGRRALLDGGEVWRERETLRFLPDSEEEPGWEMGIPVREGVFELPAGSIEIRKEAAPTGFAESDPYSIVVDANALANELGLRPWREGDRIQPLGMTGEKKVSDLLTDEKILSHQRRTMVVAISDDRIIWVPGVRLAESVRVRPEAREVLRLTYLPRSPDPDRPLESPVVTCHGEHFRRYLSRERIAARVAELAAHLDEDYRGRTPIMIGALNGSFVFMSDLIRRMTIECEVDFFKLSSYGAQKVSQGRVFELKKIDANLEGRHVIVVEDIVDTGVTMRYIMDRIREHGPASAKLVTLLRKPDAAKVTVSVDYVGFDIPDRFVIGYGLDYAQLGRNLPDLYMLDERSSTH